MVSYVRQKITIQLIYPIIDCCHIYTHDNLSVYSFYEHERNLNWNTASDVAAIISDITWKGCYCFMVEEVFFQLLRYFCKFWPKRFGFDFWNLDSQLRTCYRIAYVSGHKRCYIFVNLAPDRHTGWHTWSLDGDQRSKYGVGSGQVIEEKYNLKHMNNLRPWKVVYLERWSSNRWVGVGGLTIF